MSGSHPLDILEGRKTMTRRTWGLEKINKNPDEWVSPFQLTVDPQIWTWRSIETGEVITIKCPYGGPGDGLWVRETWAAIKLHDDLAPRDIPRTSPIWYRQKEEARIGLREINPWPEGNIGKWRPSMFMPRWASRIVREITEVRAERVQDISEEDSKAEGVQVVDTTTNGMYSPPNYPDIHRDIFMGLWDSLNAKRGHGWDKNDWVWAISFAVIGEVSS